MSSLSSFVKKQRKTENIYPKIKIFLDKVMIPYIKWEPLNGLFTTCNAIIDGAAKNFATFNKTYKGMDKNAIISGFFNEYLDNQNNNDFYSYFIKYMATYVNNEFGSQFDVNTIKKYFSELYNAANSASKETIKTYEVYEKFVSKGEYNSGEMDMVGKRLRTGLIKTAYDKICAENANIEREYGVNYHKYNYSTGKFTDFAGNDYDVPKQTTFKPSTQIMKNKTEVDWNDVSDDEDGVTENIVENKHTKSVILPAVIDKPTNTTSITKTIEIVEPVKIVADNDDINDMVYNRMLEFNEFMDKQSLFGNITGMIVEKGQAVIQKFLIDEPYFKKVMNEAIGLLDKKGRELAVVANEQRDIVNKGFKFMGEVQRDRVIVQPIERLTKSVYTQPFADYLKEREIVIPPEFYIESRMLGEYFGKDAISQPLAGSGLFQYRSTRPFSGKIFYHKLIMANSAFIYTPLVWSDYAQNTKLNIGPQEKLFRYMNDEEGLIVLAKTSMSSSLVSTMLSKGNRNSFLGTTFYIINNPYKLNPTIKTESVDYIIKNINKDNFEKMSGYNNTLLGTNFEVDKAVRKGVLVETNNILELYAAAMKLPVFNKKYKMEFITKIFTNPNIVAAYAITYLDSLEAGELPYIDKIGTKDISMALKDDIITQDSYAYVRGSTIDDILKVFPCERMEEINTGYLKDLFQVFNYTTEEYLNAFRVDVEGCLNRHINGNYSPETSVLRHLQVYLESATNQYNRMYPIEEIERMIFEIYPNAPKTYDKKDSIILQAGFDTANPDCAIVESTFTPNDILLRLALDDEFLIEYINTFYIETPEELKIINPDMLMNLDNFVKVDENAYSLVSVNKQSKGLVINKTKRSDTWISELRMANEYYARRLDMSVSPGSYSFAKIKNEVQELGKLPRNFQTMFAYVQTHGQIISTLSKAHLKRLDKGGHSLIGFPLMGSLFDELIKIIEKMEKGDTHLFNFSDNLYIVQRTHKGNIVYYSLDLVKGESSVYLGTLELMYRKWIKQFGHLLSDHYKAFLKLYMLDQVTVKTLMPASEKTVYKTSTRYLPSGSVITTDCNHENSNLIIFLTQKLNINPLVENDNGDFVITQQFTDLCASIGMRFEIAHFDNDYFKTLYNPTEMLLGSTIIKMDMLGFDAVKLYGRYLPILNYERYLKQVCFNKSGEREGEDEFYDYMRYRALIMSGYMYKVNTMTYNFLLGKMHYFNFKNLDKVPTEVIDKLREYYTTMLNSMETTDPFYDSVAKPFVDSMQFLLPPGIVDVVKIVTTKNFGSDLENKIIKGFRTSGIDMSPIDLLMFLGDRIYEPSYNDIYVNIARDLNILLSKPYNSIMKQIKTKIVGEPEIIKPVSNIKISVAVMENDLLFLKTQILRMKVYHDNIDYNVLKALFLGEPLSVEFLGSVKNITLFFSIFRLTLLLTMLRTVKQDEVLGNFNKMLKLLLKPYDIVVLPKVVLKKLPPFLEINFAGIVANNGLSSIKQFMDSFKMTYKELSARNEINKVLEEGRKIFAKNSGKLVELSIFTGAMKSHKVSVPPEFVTIMFICYGMTDCGLYISLISKYPSLHKMLSLTRLIFNSVEIINMPSFDGTNNAGISDWQMLLTFSLPYEINTLLAKVTSINTWKINTIESIIVTFAKHPQFIAYKIATFDDILVRMRRTMTDLVGYPFDEHLSESTFKFKFYATCEIMSGLDDMMTDVKIYENVYPDYKLFVKSIVYSVYYDGATKLMDMFKREWTESSNINKSRLFTIFSHLTPRFTDRLLGYYLVQNYDFFKDNELTAIVKDINPMCKNMKRTVFNPIWLNAFISFCSGDYNTLKVLVNSPIYNVCLQNGDDINFVPDTNIGLNIITYQDETLETLKTQYLNNLRAQYNNKYPIKVSNQIVTTKTVRYNDWKKDKKATQDVENVKYQPITKFYKQTDGDYVKMPQKMVEEKTIKTFKNAIDPRIPIRFRTVDKNTGKVYDGRREGPQLEGNGDTKKRRKRNLQASIGTIHLDAATAINSPHTTSINTTSPNINSYGLELAEFNDNRLYDLQYKSTDVDVDNRHTFSFPKLANNPNTHIKYFKNSKITKLVINFYDKRMKEILYTWNIYSDLESIINEKLDRTQFIYNYTHHYSESVYNDYRNVFINVYEGVEEILENSEMPMIYDVLAELQCSYGIYDAKALLDMRDYVGDLTYIEVTKLREIDTLISVGATHTMLVMDIFGNIIP